ncbi:MAG: BACON domain-containing protein [Candidatus Limisoma sp.]
MDLRYFFLIIIACLAAGCNEPSDPVKGLSGSNADVTVDADAAVVALGKFTAYGSWYTYIKGDNEWFRLSEDAGEAGEYTLTATVDANTSAAERSATIVVRSGFDTLEFRLTQTAADTPGNPDNPDTPDDPDSPGIPDNPTTPPGEIAFTDAYNIVKSVALSEYNFDMQLLRSESVILTYDGHGRVIRATHTTASGEEITDIAYTADDVRFSGALTATALISDLRLSKIDDNAMVYGEALPTEVGPYRMTWDGLNLVALSAEKSATFSAFSPVRSDANIDPAMAVALCLTDSNPMQLMQILPLLQTALYGQSGRNIPDAAVVDGTPKRIAYVSDDRERITRLTLYTPDNYGTFRQHLQINVDYYK